MDEERALRAHAESGVAPRRHHKRCISHQELQGVTLTAEQVGPAQGKPRTIVALEAAVIDWLPCARIPSWPGALGGSSREAGDTFAVRPVQLAVIADATLQGPGRRNGAWEGRKLESRFSY